MNEVLAISLQSMQAGAARVEQIGVNLANVATPGYKRGLALQAQVGASFAAHLSGAAQPAAPAADEAVAGVMLRSDLRVGSLKSTAQPLDLALAGKGYFEVMTPQGPAYTRQGSFRLDAAGRLVTAQGHPVMGQAGEITLTMRSPIITADGAILRPDGNQEAPLAQLKIVEFDSGATLERLGDGLLAAGPGLKLVDTREIQLRQGFLENSNVVSTHEMTALIQAMRHFESMHKVAQSYDDMLGTAIRKLGEST